MLPKYLKNKLEKVYLLDIKQVFRILKTSKNGLSEKEAKKRLKQFGKNEFPQKKPLTFLNFVILQLNNLLVYIILAASLISFFIGRITDGIFILFVIVLNIFIGAIQEFKAQKTFLELKKAIKQPVRVVREGKEKIIDSKEVALGDLIVLKQGDKVPADARLIKASNLACNEASLSGEFFPEYKNSQPANKELKILDRENMVFAGSLVVSGFGQAIVVATGLDTYLGEIFKLISLSEEKSNLQKKIDRFAKLIVKFVLLAIFVIVLFGLKDGQNFVDIFLASLALVVSAIPEGLLPLITVILIYGSRKIFRKRALIKKLSALESLGAVSVIVTDKTGTLTEGKMVLASINTLEKEIIHKKPFLKYKKDSNFSHILALKAGILASDAFIENYQGGIEKIKLQGSPTEKAIVLAGLQVDLIKDELLKEYPQIDFLPFDAQNRFSASLNKDGQKKVLFVLGDPDILLAKSKKIYVDSKLVVLNEKNRKKIKQKITILAKQGYRIIASGFLEIKNKKNLDYQNLKELVKDINFLGLLSLKDPLRKESAEVLEQLKQAGIKTIVATGDDKLTAFSIARQLKIGIISEKEILSGFEVEKMSDNDLEEAVKKTKVFAEIIPKDKLRIVEALKRNGEIVAMIGDGVNDAPAIKVADIGVALGSGSDTTKEAGDIILLNSNLKNIKEAVIEGRNIIENIRKVILYLVSDDFSEIFLFIFAMILGWPLPLLPVQILWMNLIEDGLPGIAFVFEKNKPKDLISLKKGWNILLSKKIKKWMIVIAIVTGLTACLSFWVFLNLYKDLNKARSVLFVLMALDSLIYAFALKNIRKPISTLDIFSNKYLNFSLLFGLALIFFGVYFPLGQKMLHLTAISASDWLLVFGISLAELIAIELAKHSLFIKEKYVH